MTTVWNLRRLISEIRQVTGNFDTSQMDDTKIIDIINDFYLYEFPEELRTLKLKGFYEFTTLPNVSTYTFQENTDTDDTVINQVKSNKAIYNLMPPVYVDGYQSAWYQDPDVFKRIWPDLITVQNSVDQGDGVEKNFSFTLNATPILPGSVTVAAGSLVLIDNAQEDSFTNPGQLFIRNSNINIGTVNYLTGAVQFTSPVALPSGTQVNVHYYPYIASRPRDILFFNQKLTLRPVPQTSYRVKLVAQYQPTVVIAIGGELSMFETSVSQNSQNLNYFEWWQLLVYGTAIKIYIRQGDHEEAARYQPYYEKMKLEAQRRTLKQMSNQRIQTIYSDGAAASVPFPPYPIY